jgi:hypothetical protein
VLGRIEKTIAPEEPAEPPTLAAMDAVRWMKRKVVVCTNERGRSGIASAKGAKGARRDERGGPIRVSAVSTVRMFACARPKEGRAYLMP